MVSNPQRRTALLDAAIEVLAAQGARGLTFRAVDTEAGVPVGTASNYFTGRDDLLRQAAEYVFVRLRENGMSAYELPVPEGQSQETVLMRQLVARAEADRAGYLAMFELRLEAARRPELREVFTQRFRANLDTNIRGYADGGHPGDATTAVVLYLAMSGLVYEHLTLPDVLREEMRDDLIGKLVGAIVPG